MKHKIPQFSANKLEQNHTPIRNPQNTVKKKNIEYSFKVFSSTNQSPSPGFRTQSQAAQNLIKWCNNQKIHESLTEKDLNNKSFNLKQNQNSQNQTILKTWNSSTLDLNMTKIQELQPIKQCGLPEQQVFGSSKISRTQSSTNMLKKVNSKDQLSSNYQTSNTKYDELFFQLGQIKVNQNDLRNASSSRQVSNRTSQIQDAQQRSPSAKRQNIKQISSGYFMQTGSQLKDHKENQASQEVLHSFNPEQYINCFRNSNEGETSRCQEAFQELDLQPLPEPEKSIPTMYSSNDIRLDTFNGNQSNQKGILKKMSAHQLSQTQKLNNMQKYNSKQYYTDSLEKDQRDRIEIFILNRDRQNQMDQPIILETTTHDKTKLIEELQQFFHCHNKSNNESNTISQKLSFSEPQKIQKYNQYIKIENLEQSLQNIQKNNCILKSNKQQHQQEGDSISTLNSLSLQSLSHQVEGKLKEDELKFMLKVINQDQYDPEKQLSNKKQNQIKPPNSSRKVSQTQFDYNTKDLLISGAIQKTTATPRSNQTTIKKNNCNGKSPLLVKKDKKLNSTTDFKRTSEFSMTNKSKINEVVYSPQKYTENKFIRKDFAQKKRDNSQSNIIPAKLAKY